jgi:hypothetical protein
MKQSIRFSLTLLMLCLTTLWGNAEELGRYPTVTGTSGFPLVSQGQAATLYVDKRDFPLARIAATMLADDVGRVTGVRPEVSLIDGKHEVRGRAVVVAGTLGHSRLVDGLLAKKKIDVSAIAGKWESFVVCTLKKPLRGVEEAFVVVGSDRRGTAYGLLTLSEKIGVSPWYWWADVKPAHQDNLLIEPGAYCSREPSVRYRGIFINDERFGGWARWAENHFDREHHVVGPKTYEKVFELLLRLKGNYLWPAMHPGTQAFNADPENARLADDYGIVMGSSHCEQMLRNNEYEWKAAGTWGDFNYVTNGDNMRRYWEERVRTNGQYENTYTIGLRGIHDYPMEGATTTEERVKLMQQAIDDQRAILQRVIGRPASEIPQVLCPYEEVLTCLHSGLRVPDDVTLVWSDDKQGFMRNLCNPEEQRRKGGSGIYYHLSYHGDPDSWLWLSPLSPALIATELIKAYEYGANRIWVFNVGDIKPAEKELSLAMELAWDIDSWRPERAAEFTPYWVGKTFGREYADRITPLQNDYYRLMAYGKEFHTRWLDYSSEEIDQRLKIFDEIRRASHQVALAMPERLRNAYFELFDYPIQGAAMMNRYILMARKSRVMASNRDTRALTAAAESKRAEAFVDSITKVYNEKIENGKWNSFFNWRPYQFLSGEKEAMTMADSRLLARADSMPSAVWFREQSARNYPSARKFTFSADKSGVMPLWISARTRIRHYSFLPENNEFATVDINGTHFRASAQPHGNIWHAEMVGPMWSCVGPIKVRKGLNELTLSDIDADATIDSLFAGIQPPFAENPLIRVGAGDYTAKHDSGNGSLTKVPLLGYRDGVVVLPYTTPSYEGDSISSAPWVEYDVDGKECSMLEVRTLPTLHVYDGRDARYAVSIDGEKPVVCSIHAEDFTSEWRWNVLRGYARHRFAVDRTLTGHRVRIFFLDPGITMQEIIAYK